MSDKRRNSMMPAASTSSFKRPSTVNVATSSTNSRTKIPQTMAKEKPVRSKFNKNGTVLSEGDTTTSKPDGKSEPSLDVDQQIAYGKFLRGMLAECLIDEKIEREQTAIDVQIGQLAERFQKTVDHLDKTSQRLKNISFVVEQKRDCRVVRDPQTLKSKGYGFVSFLKKSEAESAITAMNGQWLGSRSIRTNWATRKPPAPKNELNSKPLTFDEVYNQSSPTNCTVYCGGLTTGLTEELMQKTFQPFGSIQEIRVFKDKGYAFIRFSTKESATHAIVAVHNTEVNGQPVKCSWGKESGDPNNAQQQSQLGGAAYSPFGAYTAGGVPPSYWYNTYPQQLGGFLQGVQGVQGYSYAGQFASPYQQQYMGMGGVQVPWLGGVGGVGGVGGSVAAPPQLLHYPVQHFQVQPLGEEEWLAPSLLV